MFSSISAPVFTLIEFNYTRLYIYWRCLFLGAAAASRLYVDAISKLAKQAQQGTWGGSSDIGKQFFVKNTILLIVAKIGR